MRNVIITALVATALLVSVVPAASAKPEAREDGDKIVLSNSDVTVWFHGKKPMLKVFPVDNESAAFSYHFTQVAEYRDLNADGIPQETEIVSRLSLEKASAFEVNTTEIDGGIVLNLTLTADVKLGGGGNPLLENVSVPDRQATVVLSFAIRDGDVTIDAGDVELDVPSTAIKYDFEVVSWPFVDAKANRLALDMKVDGAVEEAAETGVTAATVAANGTAVGVLAWTTTAQGKSAAGEAVDVPVKAKLVEAGDGNATRIVFTYDAPDLASLLHDPTIGTAGAPANEAGELGETVADKVSEVPFAGALLLAAAVGLAALVVGRKR